MILYKTIFCEVDVNSQLPEVSSSLKLTFVNSISGYYLLLYNTIFCEVDVEPEGGYRISSTPRNHDPRRELVAIKGPVH
jgi:hypothetical protein